MKENEIGTTEMLPDIESFKIIQTQELDIFLKRRIKYGNHLENAKRFPHEHESGIYLKCVRIIREIEIDVELDEDTLIDLAIYAKLILSARST